MNENANKQHIFTNRPVVTRAYAQEELAETVTERNHRPFAVSSRRQKTSVNRGDCLWKVR
jgi:hypothetical protein